MIDKMNVKKGRVTSGGEKQTPIAGAPQHKSALMKGGRVKPSSEMARKNDPPKTAASRMGLHIGTRVTRGKHK